MPNRHEVIADLDALERCVAELKACPVFGLDTEFIGETSYHPELCLIQLALPGAIFLIDPFAFEDLRPFWEVIVDPAHTVVVHAGREEVRLCQVACGLPPGKLFDLQIAAGLAGLHYPMGHGALVHELLGIRLSKRETLTDWRKRPLTKDQVAYACDDVRHLLGLYEELRRRLETLGRLDWVDEECARLREQAQTDENGLVPAGEKWRKLRGASDLDRRRLAVLRELFHWRERTALKVNRPPRSLLRDDLLVEVARRNPRSTADLGVVRGLARKHSDSLMSVIEMAQKLPAHDCPSPQEREREPPQLAPLVSLLQVVLSDFCARQSLAPGLVASNADLRQLVKQRLAELPLPAACPLSGGWRAVHVLPHLDQFLTGNLSLRVSDLRAAMPFAVQ